MLLHFLRWMDEHAPGELEVDVVLLRGGPLEGEFRSLAPVRVLAPLERWAPTEVVAIGVERLGFESLGSTVSTARLLARLARTRGYDAVWLNSAAAAPVLRGLPRRLGLRVITAVHELDLALETPDPSDLDALVERTDLFVAGAEGIGRMLERRPGVGPGRVVVGHDFIDVHREIDGSKRVDAPTGGGIRKALGIPDTAFVVGGHGPITSRKGPDLFLRLGVALRHHLEFADHAEVHLVWVAEPGPIRAAQDHIGGPVSGPKFAPLAHDLRSSGLAGRVHFVGPTEDLGATLRQFDAFALTSRADALPLVCLEAALAGRPVISFDNTCLAEVFRDGEGVEVPFLDVDTMALRIAGWAGNPEVASKMGARARQRVCADFDVSIGAPRWWRALEGVLR